MDGLIFDEFLSEFWSEFVAAQRELHARHIAAEQGNLSEQEDELPAAYAPMRSRLRLTELTLSFDCELREDGSGGIMPGYVLLIPTGRGLRSSRRKLHRLDVVFRGGDAPSSVVSLDGHVLKGEILP